MWNRQAPRRMPGWDYAGPGYYFITFVTWRRRRILATIRNGRTILTPAGIAVEQSWLGIPAHYPGVTLDAFVVMPDHVHGVLAVGAMPPPPLQYQGPATICGGEACLAPARAMLSTVVASWKATATRAIRDSGCVEDGPIWQRNYYERVIRDPNELHRVRAYIRDNPISANR